MGYNKKPQVSIDILIIKNEKILLGLLTDKWKYNCESVWGVPGRDIYFGEKLGDAVRRNIKEEFNCRVINYKIICVNANYAFGNHYIGTGIIAEIDGEPKKLITQDWKEWRWFSKEEIPKNLFPPAKNLLDCYLENKFNISE